MEHVNLKVLRLRAPKNSGMLKKRPPPTSFMLLMVGEKIFEKLIGAPFECYYLKKS